MIEQSKSQSKVWRDAIAACIREYDTNDRLREVLKKTDERHLKLHAGLDCPFLWMPNKPDDFVDPMKGIHPPKKILDSIRDALNKRAAATDDANKRFKDATAAADNADSPYEKQQALEAVQFQTPELLDAWNALESAYSAAGVYALSIRSQFFVYEDTVRKSRNDDAAEKSLFGEAWRILQMMYPAQTRRLLHDAKTKEEREKIICQSRTECRERLWTIAEAEQKAKEEREKNRPAVKPLPVPVKLPFTLIKVNADGITVSHKNRVMKISSRVFGKALIELCTTGNRRVQTAKMCDRSNIKNNPFLMKYFKVSTENTKTYLGWKEEYP